MARKRQTRRRFTDEFKSETVKRVKQSDRSMADIAVLAGSGSKGQSDPYAELSIVRIR
jgi:transposase-like protein